MIKHILSLVFIFYFNSLYSQHVNTDIYGYPIFDSVVEHESKHLPTLDDGIDFKRYSLAKKREGWYVQTEKYSENKWVLLESKLCWSAATKKYLNNKTSNAKNVLDEIKNNFFKYGDDKYLFKILPFYGYRGWTDDVINYLDDSSELCDSHLEALARAYSAEAFYRIGQRGDWGVIGREMKLADKPNCMLPSQVDTFRKYEHLSIQTYLRLLKQNPNYETQMGKIFTKYSNEIMSCYLILAYYQNFKEAEKELKNDLYDSYIIAFAKNLLNSCGQNGILFTSGDNDTYPLYYVQAKLGFRKDVLVVNTSLLGTSRYINFLRRGVFDAPSLPLTFSKDEYAGNSLDYVRNTNSEFDLFLKQTGLDFLPESTVLYKWDIILLNMIAANQWERPIYISMTTGPGVILNMDAYLRLEGLAYHLTQEKSSQNKWYDVPVNTDFSFPFFNDHFQLTDWNSMSSIDAEALKIATVYQEVYSRTAAALLTEKRYDDCALLLNKYLKIFPEDKIPYSVFMIEMPDLFVRSNHTSEGKILAEKLISFAKDKYNSHIDNFKTEEFIDWRRNIREALFILQELTTFVKANYDIDTFAGTYESEFLTKKEKYYSLEKQITGSE